MIDKFKLIKKYPGSPELGTVVFRMDEEIFINKDRTFLIDAKVLEEFPENWEQNEKIDFVEIRLKTNKGNKIIRSDHKTDLVNGYRFSFPNGIVMDIIIDEEETDINFCKNA